MLSVVHRDLKPENILIDPERERLVIANLGIALFQQEEIYTALETRDITRPANLQYAAPEQRHRGRQVTRQTDIYTLGLILNEMLPARYVSAQTTKQLQQCSTVCLLG